MTAPPPADTRGSLRVADRVIEKIAAAAAAEITHTVAVRHRLGERRGRVPAARASAVVAGRIVELRVTTAAHYPVSLIGVSREVREHVRDTVTRLCDVEVRDVDVDISLLRREPGTTR